MKGLTLQEQADIKETLCTAKWARKHGFSHHTVYKVVNSHYGRKLNASPVVADIIGKLIEDGYLRR